MTITVGRINRYLPGAEQQIADAHGMIVWADGGGGFCGFDDGFVWHKSFLLRTELTANRTRWQATNPRVRTNALAPTTPKGAAKQGSLRPKGEVPGCAGRRISAGANGGLCAVYPTGDLLPGRQGSRCMCSVVSGAISRLVAVGNWPAARAAPVRSVPRDAAPNCCPSFSNG